MEKLVLTNQMVGIIRKTLIEGITIASGSKNSATYYHSKDDQTKAIQGQVRAMYGISKELPLIIATQKGATGKFISEVLINEFRNTYSGGACNIINPKEWYDNGLSDKAILSSLNNLSEAGLPYVLRLFIDIENARINNDRSRKIMLGFVWGQDNLEFYALKYRNKIARVLRHAYGKKLTSILLTIARKQVRLDGTYVFANEKEASIVNDSIMKYFNGSVLKAFKLFLFIMKRNVDVSYSEFPLLAEYEKAKVDITNIKSVPEEVLVGLISSVKHPQHQTMWGTSIQKEATKALIRKNVEVTSANQQVRQTKSTAKLGVEKTVDMEKVTDFLALYKTGYENGWTEELKGAINVLAEKKKINGFFYQNIGIIVDDSNSMAGNKNESKNTPKAIVDFTARVLGKSAKNAIVVKTNSQVTDLATSFVELLKKENPDKLYDAIFILTDGYENSYDGLTNEVISIFKAETGRNIPTFQISPITSAEMDANVRKLGSDVITMAVNNPVALQPQINARLLEIDTSRWLLNQVLALEASPLRRTKKISINA
jgi:hypothetical protein